MFYSQGVESVFGNSALNYLSLMGWMNVSSASLFYNLFYVFYRESKRIKFSIIDVGLDILESLSYYLFYHYSEVYICLILTC